MPHAFQQQLSYEKTPTLCNAFPAFEGLKRAWKQHQTEHPETFAIVQDGLNKLDGYRDRADNVSAYVLAMCMCQFIFLDLSLTAFCTLTVINPKIKLKWHEKFEPAKAQEVKQTVLREVCV